jgi:mannan endo-1,4-beta-mannosidase
MANVAAVCRWHRTRERCVGSVPRIVVLLSLAALIAGCELETSQGMSASSATTSAVAESISESPTGTEHLATTTSAAPSTSQLTEEPATTRRPATTISVPPMTGSDSARPQMSTAATRIISPTPTAATTSGAAATWTTTTKPPPPPRRGLGIEDGRLVVDGDLRPLIGVNAPGAASSTRLGSACGNADVDLDLMFSLLPDRSLVRVWFTQRMATDIGSITRDWSPLDAVVAAAERSAKRPILVVTLATSDGACDGGEWRDRGWFDGGFLTQSERAQPETYMAWVDSAVTRYESHDVIGAWEPINEPNPASCLDGYHGSGCFGHSTCAAGAAQSLRAFFNTVGGRIHRLDRNALVSTGGAGWCGWSTPDEAAVVESSPVVDIVSIHDYYATGTVVPDAVTAAVRRARTLGKPVLVGELGISATSNEIASRASTLVARAAATTRTGVDAVVLWTFGYGGTCGFCLLPTDPIYPMLATARFTSGY